MINNKGIQGITGLPTQIAYKLNNSHLEIVKNIKSNILIEIIGHDNAATMI